MLLTNQIAIARKTGKIFSLLLFVLWGTFFIEHLSWFYVEVNNRPTVQIWFAQVFHLFLLTGYLISLKWEKIGSGFIIVNSVLFFGFAAGVNSIPFVIVSSFPVMMFAFCWMKERNIDLISKP